MLSGLTAPVYLETLPDGRMLLLQKTGDILIFDPAEQPAQTAPYLRITNIETGEERGLTSIALDPDFTSNGFIYVYYTHGTSRRNRVSRFTHSGSTASLASEVLIWQDNENWSNCCHYGGGIGFGPDGRLYLTTGEEFDGAQAQDLTRAGGKVIRINKDGSVPADNPFADGPGGNLDEIWALGLRNPYRAHWDLPTGRFFIGEVGGNVQSTASEDLHLGRAGANYGWPACEGFCADPAYDDPIYAYPHTTSTPSGGAITAGFVYRGGSFPASFQGAFFFADYALSFIRYLTFDAGGAVASVNDFVSNVGAPVSLEQGPDGALYAADYAGGRVLRFRHTAGNQPPLIDSATGAPTQGAPPLDVDFTATATDPEDDALTYRWFFGDGQEATGRNVTHTYTSSGSFEAVVVVSDATGSTTSDPIVIEVGTAPTVTIDAPQDGLLFRAGDVISYSGSADDPDETIPPSQYLWTIDFVHNEHVHPVLTEDPGTGGEFEIARSGHDWHDDTGYRFTLVVTDSEGLSRSDSIMILPDKVDLRFETAPAGIPVSVDGLAQDAPFVYDTLINFEHTISVPDTTCIGGEFWRFSSWSDGGSREHLIVVPDANATLTATYVSEGPCDELPTSGLVTRLEADTGVSTAAGGQVTSWLDQTSFGNNLVAAGDPMLLPSALNGRPVIDFDGSGDKLERTSGVAGLPSGNADRSVFLVANYRGTGYGGFSWGTNRTNRTFGLIVNAAGRLMVQAWGNANDFDSGVAGTGQGWLVQSAVLAGGQLTHYRDGNPIDTRTHTYNTALTRIVLGAEIDSSPFIDMQVAAVLVYDRALSANERQQVQSYLQTKYLSGGGGNQAPAAGDDTATVAAGGSVTISVLDNDSDPDGSVDPATVFVTQDPASGTAVANPDGTITYTHDGSATATDTFSYQVSDDGGLASNEAAVAVTIEGGGGGQAPVASDDTATVAAGGTATIDVLANDSDDGTLDPATLVVTAAPQNGTAVANADGTV
ncbi:MAG: PQQ-dependent sugar dehydrogenase, partial [Gammaproteobacteria bacterium]|nr:PQQ-dependent sugar dehydrogenase [Gammaproteobacteria bacterium]